MAPEAFDFAEELRQAVADLCLAAGERIISISAGATVSRLSIGMTFENLMSRSDEALYSAKSLGCNRVAMWRRALPVAAGQIALVSSAMSSR